MAVWNEDTNTKQQLAELDLSNIEKKLMLLYGWAPRHAREACRQYRNFLFLLKKYHPKSFMLVPSDEIDEVWHLHILDTKKYEQDCIAIFGRFIHHHPGSPWESVDGSSHIDFANCFDKTQELYKNEFGDYIYMVRPFSPRRMLKNTLLRWRCARVRIRQKLTVKNNPLTATT